MLRGSGLFFFKQKTAYAMRISDWSSDVCSSDLAPWALKKTDPERMRVVLSTLFICIRDLAIAISPVIPASAANLLDQLGIPENERDHAALRDPDWYERLSQTDFTLRSEEHTSELQSLMRISYAVFCLKKK